jgi:hypothetical protein
MILDGIGIPSKNDREYGSILMHRKKSLLFRIQRWLLCK